MLYFHLSAFVSGVRRRKVKKILYDKYVPRLAIRDEHVTNNFNDKLVSLYHVGCFINGDRRKLITRYICLIFYISDILNFVFLHFERL